MSKVFCLTCNHKCHCVGMGFYVNSTECGCGCFDCTCKGLPIMEDNMIDKCKNICSKAWSKVTGVWNKYKEWIFKGFYK